MHRPSAPAGDTPELAFRQAVELYNQGRLADSERLYRQILKQHPRNFATLYNLAGVVWRAERFEEAVRLLRKALKQNPNSAAAHILLGKVFRSLGRYDDALMRIRKAIALAPLFADAHDAHARVLADLGEEEQAIQAQNRAIDLAPDQPRYYFSLGLMMRWTDGDLRLAALKAFAQKPMSRDDRVHLHFALGKAYADCGNADEAFRQQMQGGALKRQTIFYDEASTLRQMDEMCRAIDTAWLMQRHGEGDPSKLPVFILGMPRSGSTLVEQILAAHPKVRSSGESAAFTAALANIADNPVVQAMAQWSGPELKRLARSYLETLKRQVPAGATRIIDKTPWNFRYLGLILAALPGARIIHTCRDPIETSLSIFSILFWGDSQPYSYDLGELGRYYRAYDKMMTHWHDSILPGVVLDVRYENLVEDFEPQARRIITHCGLEWDDACLTFASTREPIRTASQLQVRKPLYRTSLRRPRPGSDLLKPLLAALDPDAPTDGGAS
ncbi:MAG TPA: sulfotransferase [Rhizomicrobium sp.]|nr:sulfotransferase [Rhizomicrobium sp.]